MQLNVGDIFVFTHRERGGGARRGEGGRETKRG